MTTASQYREHIVDMLADCNLFNNFSPDELQRASAYFNISEIREGEVIFREGDDGHFMGIIHSGHISVLKSDSNNNPVEMAKLKKGKVFGEMAVLDGERRSATCTASGNGSLLTLSRDSLDRMMEEQPRIAAKVTRAIAVSVSQRLRLVDFKVADHQL